MMQKPHARNTRQAILAAAGRVIVAMGVSALTLEAVAREAGLSKGGVLYHFPTKNDLIAGMVRDSLARFDAALAPADDEATTTAPGRWLRAYIRASFAVDHANLTLEAALLAGVAIQPALLDPYREAAARWQSHAVEDGIDPVLATIVRLAADGLYLADLLGLAPLDGAIRARVQERLLQISTREER